MRIPTRGEEASENINERHAGLLWLPVGFAGDAHQAADGLHEQVVAGELGGAAAEAGERAVDEPGVGGAQRPIAEAELVHQPRAEVLHEHVSLAGELARPLGVLRRSKVEHDAALVAVHGLEIGGSSARVERWPPAARLIAAAWSLDLQDVRAEIAEQHRRERPGQHAREVEDPQLAERPGHWFNLDLRNSRVKEHPMRAAAAPERAEIRPLDFLDIDRLLDEQEREIRDTVRAFVRAKVLPEIATWFEDARIPRELPAQLGALGLLGMHLEGYGCAGTSATAYGLACMELEAGDSGIRSLVSVQGSLAMFAIHRFGSEEQSQRWLPEMAAGRAVGCFGLTEPDSGSDPASMRTRARRDGEDWILHGQKMWITNGSIADVAVVWARTDEGVRGFLVPRGTNGFTTQDIHAKLSLRASVTSELLFDDVRLPAAAMLPQASSLAAPLACLNEARFGIVWGAAGAARACFESALAYSGERVQFGRPIASFQLQQHKLAMMALEVNRATLLALHLGRLKDEGRLAPEQVSMGKLGNVNAALEVARSARQVLGANGITLEYPVIRHMNNLESVLTYEGTADVHALIIGGALTGISAFR